MCVYATHPLGFLFSPQMPFPKPPIPCSLFRGLIIGAAVNRKVKGRGRGSGLIDTPRPDQSTCLFPSTNKVPACVKTKEREEKERQKELGGVRERENVNTPASLNRSQKLRVFFPQFRMTLSRTRTLMSGVRHRDAPVMPLGPSVFAPDLRHLVGDLDPRLLNDRFLMAITHTWPSWSSLVAAIILKKKKRRKKG